MHFRMTRPMELFGCKEMTCSKLETAAGLYFAEDHLVLDDMKMEAVPEIEIQAICLSARLSEL